MLKTKVKASSITNLTDARYFAAWEVEWLSFNFNSGEDTYISPTNMKAIKEWVDGVKIIGTFNLHSAEEIASAVELLELDGVEVSPFIPVEDIELLHRQEIPVLQEIIISTADDLMQINQTLAERSTFVEYFILNFDKNGMAWEDLTEEHINNLMQLCQRFSILLSIQYSSADVLLQILDQIKIEGICVQGGAEEKVGFKSFDELDDTFEALEVLV
jgi:phosphoribosylanthranilate isomerase